ncbi:TIGR04222 domain-containing membrane protein [Streptomyces sp. NPDC101733]|uniref:TIGR04222 domain-containing membrane protein n=1 Tax=unclassified Streptomyces TaxID=2593676 RepID=UPI00382AD4B0
MFRFLFLLLAWAAVLVACTRLLRAATEAAEPVPGSCPAPGPRELSLYEAAYLAGGPERVAVLTLLSMERRRRLLLAHTGWATLLDPVGGDPHERSVLGAFGPDGQCPVPAVRAAAASAEAVRALADRLGEAGLTLPAAVRGGVAEGVRSVRRATAATAVLAAASLALPAPGAGTGGILWWFALPLLLCLGCLAIAAFEGPAHSPWASPAGRGLLAALLRERRGPDSLMAVALRGPRALRDRALRSALA